MQMDVGNHVAKAVQAYLSETKEHNEYVAVELARVDDPKQTIFWSGYLGDKPGRDLLTNTQRTMRTLRLLGLEGDDISDLRGVTKNEVEVVVADEEFNGKQYRKCQFINELGGGAFRPRPIEASRAKRVAEQIKEQLSRLPTSDDDIPF